jgi:hypothetical protein
MEWIFIGFIILFAIMTLSALLYFAPKGYEDEYGYVDDGEYGYHDWEEKDTTNLIMIVNELGFLENHPWAVIAQVHEHGYILFGSYQAAKNYNEGKKCNK